MSLRSRLPTPACIAGQGKAGGRKAGRQAGRRHIKSGWAGAALWVADSQHATANCMWEWPRLWLVSTSSGQTGHGLEASALLDHIYAGATDMTRLSIQVAGQYMTWTALDQFQPSHAGNYGGSLLPDIFSNKQHLNIPETHRDKYAYQEPPMTAMP